MEDKEQRVISSIEKTHQTNMSGKHFFMYQENITKRMEEVIEQVCEIYNKHSAAKEIPEVFKNMMLQMKMVFHSEYKAKLQMENMDLDDFNKLHQKSKPVTHICFAPTPLAVKKVKSYK